LNVDIKDVILEFFSRYVFTTSEVSYVIKSYHRFLLLFRARMNCVQLCVDVEFPSGYCFEGNRQRLKALIDTSFLKGAVSVSAFAWLSYLFLYFQVESGEMCTEHSRRRIVMRAIWMRSYTP
jgi:hypothetical protein